MKEPERQEGFFSGGPGQDLHGLVRDLKKHLVLLREMGWKGWDPESETLADIEADAMGCANCGLSKARKNIVFGAGDPGARLLFIGEGPGHDEDLAGEPFVGAAGQLLDRIIQAMGLERKQVYIANMVKCRPPGNRDPEPAEIEACIPYLKRQISVIRPEYICVLGRVAAQALLKTQTPISRLRGKVFDFEGVPLMPTFHPAYLLRNAEKKREVWNDVQKIMQALDLGHGR